MCDIFTNVSDPENPLVLLVIELQGTYGTSLAFDADGTTVFVGIPEGVEAYNLTDPDNPQLAGVIAATGSVAIAPNDILVTAGQDLGLTTHRLFASQDDLSEPPPAPSNEPAPFPPKGNDRVFSVDEAPLPDTECRFNTSGPIVFNIPITRYVSEVDPDTGTLESPEVLKLLGALSAEANLTLMVYDADSGAGAPLQPEIDRVLFNGEEVGFL